MARGRSSSAAASAVREHATPLGVLRSYWTPLGLCRIEWSAPESESQRGAATVASSLGDPPEIARFDACLQRYFACGEDSFGEVRVDSRGWSDFARRVYRCCRQIPASATWTYQQLAAAAGSPRASRAVGAAMARNQVPLVIPCHRVVAASGRLRGFSAPGGLETKQRLLSLEREGRWPADQATGSVSAASVSIRA